MYKRQCMCKIPNKLVLTDVNGNNNHGLPHENIELIKYRLSLQDKKAGLYIKHNTDPFTRTVLLCPDSKGMTDIKTATISEMMQQFSNTTNRFNVCIDKPAKFNRSAANTILRLNNQIPTQLLRINPALHCQSCVGSRPEHATENKQQKTTHIILSLIHI